MGVGYTNHGSVLNTSDIDNLNNGDKQGIYYSIGCWPAAFDYGECIAEHYVHDTNGGGLAFVGNTRYGWYSPYNDDFYSLRYDRYFFRSLFDQGHHVLGECYSDHKNDGYQYNTTYQYCFTTLSLLGDPALPIWTENPVAMDVTHPSILPVGTSSFTVHAEDGGSNLSGVLVCLWKDDEVYMSGTTDSGGDVTLNPVPATPGTMLVTATNHNYLPYEGSAEVTGELPDVTITVTPVDTIIPRTEYLVLDVDIANNSGVGQTFDAWTMVTLPNGSPFGPVAGPAELTLPSGGSFHKRLSHRIPITAPLGMYSYTGNVGDHPDSVWDDDTFEFEVIE